MFSRSARAVAIQRDLNGVEKILISKWPGQELHGPGFHRTNCHWDISVPRDEDDGNMNIGAVQLSLRSARSSQAVEHQE